MEQGDKLSVPRPFEIARIKQACSVLALLQLAVLVIPGILAWRGIGNRGGWAAGGAACLLLSLLGCFLTYANVDADAALKTQQQRSALSARAQVLQRAIEEDLEELRIQMLSRTVKESTEIEKRMRSAQTELRKVQKEIAQAEKEAVTPNAASRFTAAMFFASIGCLLAAAVFKQTPARIKS
jgi:hypothetical protein